MMLWISAVMMAKYTGKLLDMESPPGETDGLFLWYNLVKEALEQEGSHYEMSIVQKRHGSVIYD